VGGRDPREELPRGGGGWGMGAKQEGSSANSSSHAAVSLEIVLEKGVTSAYDCNGNAVELFCNPELVLYIIPPPPPHTLSL
jgi:hypothetical protein